MKNNVEKAGVIKNLRLFIIKTILHHKKNINFPSGVVSTPARFLLVFFIVDSYGVKNTP
jgi:hypothetical protein